MKTIITEFKQELEALLQKYGATITITTVHSLMEYPAITFLVDGKEYWSVDEDGYAASNINHSDVENIIPK